MNKTERDQKIEFIKILLTVGALLGTALTISNVVQVWEISLIALCLFILFSIIYYNLVRNHTLKSPKKIKYFHSVSQNIAYSFAILFMNVFSKPLTSAILSISNLIKSISFSVVIIKLVVGSILLISIVLGYLFVLSRTIYEILTKGTKK
jgi:hypothetical protein